jgi:aminoglycoside phosphotransferase (APT) family kinase protein
VTEHTHATQSLDTLRAADSPIGLAHDALDLRAGAHELLDLAQAAPQYPPAPEVVERIVATAQHPHSGEYTRDRRATASARGFATDLAEFIAGVRRIDTRGRRYRGHGRGGVLADHDEWIQECLTQSEGLLDVGTLSRIWEAMRELPRGDSPDVMNHGDLLPGNLLIREGRLTGVRARRLLLYTPH